MIFSLLNIFDSFYFYSAICLLALFYFHSYRVIVWVSLLILMGRIVSLGKMVFDTPRPCHIDPAVAYVSCPLGGSFPSGGAAGALFLAFFLSFFSCSPHRYVAALVYTLIFSTVRVVLGVHYPVDLLGGWILAIVFLAIGKELLPDDRFPRIVPFHTPRLPALL